MVLRDVIVAGGREQDRLGFRAERLGRARQQHMADRLGAGRAAGLARQHDADAERLAGDPPAVAAWVDLPVPSPPSKVMKRPRMTVRNGVRDAMTDD